MRSVFSAGYRAITGGQSGQRALAGIMRIAIGAPRSSQWCQHIDPSIAENTVLDAKIIGCITE